jgi:hypothetical protein
MKAGLWFGSLIQGWKSSAIIVFFALGFHALVWLSGSLYVAMVVHIAYDITAGLSYGRLGKEFGYSPEFNESSTRPPLEIVACGCPSFAPAVVSLCEIDRALV